MNLRDEVLQVTPRSYVPTDTLGQLPPIRQDSDHAAAMKCAASPETEERHNLAHGQLHHRAFDYHGLRLCRSLNVAPQQEREVERIAQALPMWRVAARGFEDRSPPDFGDGSSRGSRLLPSLRAA